MLALRRSKVQTAGTLSWAPTTMVAVPTRSASWPGNRRAKTGNDDKLIGMSSEPLPPSTLATLAGVLPDYGKAARKASDG